MTLSATTRAILLAGAALLAAAADWLPAPIAAVVLAATFLVTPGLVAVQWLLPGATHEMRAASVLVLAPFLSGALLSGLAAMGVPLPVAARAVALAAGTGALMLGLPRTAAAPGVDALARIAWIAAGAWTLLMGALLVGNPFLPPRADGWFHAALTLQIAGRGLPPEDPYFAGLRLFYFWGAHAWAAGWLALAPRLAVWTPLVAFNLAASLATVLGLAALARRLGAGPRRTAFAVALATLGYSPFAWLAPVARAASGAVRGPDELARSLDAGADAVLGQLATGQLHASTAFFGDKFLVLTQFGIGIALVPLAAVALLELIDRPSRRATLALAALLGAGLFLHTVTGSVLVVLVAAAALLQRPSAQSAPLGRRTVMAIALAIVLPAAVLSPYLFEITVGKQPGLGSGFRSAHFVTLLVGAAAYLVPGLAWITSRLRASRDAGVLLAAAVVLLAFALGVRLPENNESKFYNLLFILLAAPAAMGWTAWLARLAPPGRLLVTGALAVGTLPTVGFALAGFASERGQAGLSWHAPSAAVAEAAAWARAHTTPDAAFCDLGGGRELLALSGRSVLWGGYLGERDWGYPDSALAARRDLAGALVRGVEPGPLGERLLARLHRDVIVMARSGAPDSLTDHGRIAARPERYTELWHNGEVAFWKVRRP